MSDSKIEKLSVAGAVEKHREFLFPAVATYYSEPLSIEKGEGSYVWDGEGRKYLDCFGGVLTVSVGHQNPNVKNAIIGQLDRISHTSTLYVSQSQIGRAHV